MTGTKNTVSDERLARAILDAPHPEKMAGAHLSTDARAQLAFAQIDNFKRLALQSLRASIPGGVGVKLEALAYDWEYIDPKTSHWSYARTPERAKHLQAQGVKLTPVYTLEVVRQAQSVLDLSPAEGEPARWEIIETLPSGAHRWRVVEHEHHAREVAKTLDFPTTIRPLYAAPSNPVISDEMVAAALKIIGMRVPGEKRMRDALTAALSVQP